MRLLALLLFLPAAATGAPGVPDDAGWQFATCQTRALCTLDTQSCTTLMAPGASYIWRDADGLRFGGSARAAVPVASFDSLSAAMGALTPTSNGPVLIIPPDHVGPGDFWLAHFNVTAGSLGNRFDQMRCETSDIVPATPLDAPELPSPPEVLPPAPPLELLD